MGRGGGREARAAGGAARRAAKLRGADGLVFEVEPGVLDRRAEAAYTQGQCHALALAVCERTGWPIVAAEDEEADICHFFVRCPDGRLLDVAGAREEAEALEQAHASFCPGPEYLVEQPAEWVARLHLEQEGWRASDLEIARSFVEPLLRACGLGER